VIRWRKLQLAPKARAYPKIPVEQDLVICYEVNFLDLPVGANQPVVPTSGSSMEKVCYVVMEANR